jgi:hypothetical protein
MHKCTCATSIRPIVVLQISIAISKETFNVITVQLNTTQLNLAIKMHDFIHNYFPHPLTPITIRQGILEVKASDDYRPLKQEF